LDLDHFKRVNDRHGHQVGDQVLKRLARYILSNIRPYDRLFRYGGEEFLLSMPQTPLDSAAALAERLREEIARQPLAEIDDEAITVTVSFGVAELTAECEVETVIQRADQALYSAKRSGRNRVCRWSVDTPHDG
ncbi:MAG TPA: GGDEF domain-containing protein, partial [Gammaproteobacteria bacterium]